MERQLTAVPNTDGSWSVTLHTVGTYNAFASPLTGQPWTGSGRIDSTSTWTVPVGSYAPSKANLPAQSGNSLRSQNLVSEFFGVKDGSVLTGQAMVSGSAVWDCYGIPGADSNGIPGLMEQTG